ncbi:MAG: thymidine phosphorylase [Firmicutes bacterium]|nr:thymidine phosphorylase [Bacillota bacterium]
MSLTAYNIITKKRDGFTLSKEEINFLIGGYAKGEIPDYQIAAFLMAVFFQGLDEEETADLTLTMAHSGDMLKFDDLGYVLDKHSTGGVGDTTTLIVLPLVAAAGGKIAKLSGRGLGHTGGTIDKLEAIPGFRTTLSNQELKNQVLDIGLAIAGQTGNLVPADKLLYALRDVTGTVESIPLIASSIMSKKIAGGAHGIVLDVKVGKGAFMKDINEARKLAKLMVALGSLVGKRVTAVLSDMDVPLSKAQGNTLEVIEAINVLKGVEGRSKRLQELSEVLATEMLALDSSLDTTLDFPKGYNSFVQVVERQGGDLSKLSLSAPFKEEIITETSGYFSDADALAVGKVVRDLGAGRRVKGEKIDSNVGVLFNKDLGDEIKEGELLATVYASNKNQLDEAVSNLREVLVVGPKPYDKPVVLEVIRGGSR